MASPANTTNNAALLRTLFQDRPPAWTGYQTSKFLASVSHDREYGGDDNATVNVTIAAGSGVSASFEEAAANMDATVERRFSLGFRSLYAVGAITGDAIARSRIVGKHAIAKILDHNIRHLTEKFNRALAAQLWSIGGGAFTTIPTGTTLSGTTIVCSPASDVTRFEINDYVQFASDNGTGSAPAGLRDGGKRLRVTAVSPETGTVTFDAALNTVAAIAVGDFIFRAGTYGLAFNSSDDLLE